LPNAPFVSTLKKTFKVIHPFHPDYGKIFDLVNYRNSWKSQYVEYIGSDGILCSIPLSWTDAAGIDAFIEISKGRSFFHIKSLLRLCELAGDLSEKKIKSNLGC
jgi:hypothetical protein